MRFFTGATCVAAALAPVSALSIFNGNAPATLDGDDDRVPGDSPLKFCSASRDNDLVTIDHVDLSPNPPKPGEELIIKATGTVKQAIEEGAYVDLSVKYGLIKLLSLKADFCDQIHNVDLECPVKEGKLSVEKSVDIPKEVPPGTYTVLADVFDKNDNRITCLTATVQFHRGGSFLFGSDL